ncbi:MULTISPECIES: MaoC family dehydratase [Nocardiaceae]|jgi:acyl dehydratase|uniref:MaoC family dehydratase n=1 Tax=Nocardiaceae TaxID=85025 RepID=UPI00055A2032|nr:MULTISPECIES: MaoC family dehydratase [Rhodococcus]OZE95485.1 enoyl-CoA hydratase [Rhodococcus sp. 15-1189-1-1a]OZF10116.1 enoyl-CoA hydratase [Rhodococcus sp. 14-2686-1-2]OZF55546.1 enoyl-CoA hydratase [Rhodococcus sp. 14-2470-1b]
MRTFTTPADLDAAVGEELGTSEWTLITQEMVDHFAAATGDHQWIHVDVDRATRESPFGGPIAHGYLSLALLPALAAQIYAVDGAKLVVNYGSNKVRFVNPVRVGARVRLRSVFTSVEEVKGGALQVSVSQTLEIEDAPKPALVAEAISRVLF